VDGEIDRGGVRGAGQPGVAGGQGGGIGSVDEYDECCQGGGVRWEGVGGG